MKNIQREDIQIISRHSNLSDEIAQKALQETVYNNKANWQKFLKLLFLSLGIGFTVSGIVFFFAYNWTDLHKFIKIGLAESLLIATASTALCLKNNVMLRNIILTGAAILVGVLFAVFGQIYQTGANAYDFFLAWTVFITLWVIVSDFAVLWLLYLLLINTTFVLYSEQEAQDWSEITIFTVLFLMNAITLIIATILAQYKESIIVPKWFRNIITLASVTAATIGIVIGIFGNYQFSFPVLVFLASIAFASAIWYGFKSKSSFYLSIIPFSIIIIISALLIKASDEAPMLLMISIFIIASVTLVIRGLLNLQKKWANEQ